MSAALILKRDRIALPSGILRHRFQAELRAALRWRSLAQFRRAEFETAPSSPSGTQAIRRGERAAAPGQSLRRDFWQCHCAEENRRKFPAAPASAVTAWPGRISSVATTRVVVAATLTLAHTETCASCGKALRLSRSPEWPNLRWWMRISRTTEKPACPEEPCSLAHGQHFDARLGRLQSFPNRGANCISRSTAVNCHSKHALEFSGAVNRILLGDPGQFRKRENAASTGRGGISRTASRGMLENAGSARTRSAPLI